MYVLTVYPKGAAGVYAQYLQDVNGEKLPSSSLWILITILGFTYLLGRNLEFEKGLGVSESQVVIT